MTNAREDKTEVDPLPQHGKEETTIEDLVAKS